MNKNLLCWLHPCGIGCGFKGHHSTVSTVVLVKCTFSMQVPKTRLFEHFVGKFDDGRSFTKPSTLEECMLKMGWVVATFMWIVITKSILSLLEE